MESRSISAMMLCGASPCPSTDGLVRMECIDANAPIGPVGVWGGCLMFLGRPIDGLGEVKPRQ